MRDVDFTQQGDIQAAINRIGGGSIAENEIAYADLTGDQIEDAIVPISSGGTMGNMAYLVFEMEPGGPKLILTRTLTPNSPGGLSMTVEQDTLVEYVGEYGPEDPFCCPSILRRTTFRWDGAALQTDKEERVPAGQHKE